MSITSQEIIAATNSLQNYLDIFEQAFSQTNAPFLQAHRVILTACYSNPGLAAKIKAKTPEAIAQTWLKKYDKSYQNRASQRISKLPGTIADPIIQTIIQARLPQLTPAQLHQINYAHRLAMSAENIQGLLLEEFLAEQLLDYGWHCCWGEVIRHVDFCHEDGSLLQIKNRNNSENSSSAKVREHYPIEKWFRIKAATGQYEWDFFNDKYKTHRFSEENFIDFVRQVLHANPNALSIEAENPWQKATGANQTNLP
jgi:hypothetical protein